MRGSKPIPEGRISTSKDTEAGKQAACKENSKQSIWLSERYKKDTFYFSCSFRVRKID